MKSDDYPNVLNLYQVVHRGHAMLNVCLQEAFQFHVAGRPFQTSSLLVQTRRMQFAEWAYYVSRLQQAPNTREVFLNRPR
ncbi:Protein CBG00226 [Caenorhabditis briggsae]|uniref:Uncharacterized protein n=2 Tax=Caenorhabditis briggsae TaxID=6238 RepID=A0AAE9CVI9_CAEBR|nr:Protein CBG00226 [Caenorhabditis briggsae]ULT83654.1 hypothetical protein L3Y34_012715 [Caenorhabditis briggsae]CAP21685.2 Protein CBG00226 [Caenorhabditis briggsae]